MPSKKAKHLTIEQRRVIEDGIRASDSARTIAKRIGCSASTVTREVERNRTIVKRNKKVFRDNPSLRCAKRKGCKEVGSACAKCSTQLTECKHCKVHPCIGQCQRFELLLCPTTRAWPFICPDPCAKKAACNYPVCSYDARDANDLYIERRSQSRAGISLTMDEFQALRELVNPLVRQGLSFEAIWAAHADELPICIRSAYYYQEAQLLGLSALEFPRLARLKPRKKAKGAAKRERIDRDARRHDDFLALPIEDQARVCQCDSISGYDNNVHDVLTMHLVAYVFQFYILKEHASSKATVAAFDHIERVLGSPEAFEAIFGIILADRGSEFDDWQGMERSLFDPRKRRCRVFYCDAMDSNQKSPAERNHQRIRRILPKGRSDFDKLSQYDVAVCASHVNSYPLARLGGRCAFDLASGLLPKTLLDELGYAKVAPDEIVLKPYLMSHAVKQ